MGDQCITVLHVEDNPDDAFLLRKVLAEVESAQYVVERADCLTSALNLLASRPFDIVLLDLTLPDSRDIDTVRAMLKAASSSAIVVLSGVDDDVLAVESVRIGAQDYLAKSRVDAYSLERSMRYAIERKDALLALTEASRWLELQVQEYSHDLAAATERVQQTVRDRMRTEQALRASENMYHGLFEHAPDAIVVINDQGQIERVNEQTERMFGYSRQELHGCPITDLMPERQGQQRFDDLSGEADRPRRQNAAAGMTLYGRRKSGADFPVQVTLSPLRAGDGSRMVTAIIRDVTERIETAAALHRVEQRYRLLVESVQDYAILILNTDGYVISWNKGAERIKGYTAGEIIGKHFSCFYPPTAQRRASAEHALVVAATQGHYEEEGWLVRKDGSRFWARATVTALRDETGELYGYAKVTRDLTDAKRTREALLRSEQYFRSLIENALDLITILDVDGTVRYQSPAAERVLGYPFADMIGSNVFKLLHPDDETYVKQVFTEVLEIAGATRSIECRVRHRTEGWRTLEALARYIVDDKGLPCVVVNARDITRHKQVEEELTRSREQMHNFAIRLQHALEEERTRIAREVHDVVGQALSALQMNLSWIGKRLPDGVEPIAGRISVMSGLIDRTLDASHRLVTALRPEILDDFGLAAAVEWQVQQFQEECGIECRLTLSAEEIAVDSDTSVAVFRILQEALTNVSRHADATQVEVALWSDAGNLALEVGDNGRGMDETRKPNASSFGILGMQERALICGGKLSVKSVPGKGTQVKVTVPLSKTSQAYDHP